MNAIARSSRRRFLRNSATLGAVLVVGFMLPRGLGRFARADEPKGAGPPRKSVPPDAFIRVGKDGTVTVVIKHLEFGQGINTTLAMIVAEELECDWSRVRTELAPAAPEYAHTGFGLQMTGGSSSTWEAWDQLRTAGAQARTMLVAAAAQQWKVNATDCRAEKGFVVGPRGQRLSYGQLTAAASRRPVPSEVKLKAVSEFKRIGQPTRRLDSAEKTSGQARFGLDVQHADLHVAVVARPPVFGARVKSFDAEKVKAVPGVTHVVALKGGVAVLGKGFWAAKKGRDVLVVEWEGGHATGLSSDGLGKKLREAMQSPGATARKAEGEPKAAARTLVAEYEVPFLAHAPMEPLNCTVIPGDGSAEIWTGTQLQGVDHPAAAKALGLPPEKVRLNTTFAGGGFGRRANPVSDYVIEACEIARRAKVPVKVIWTREDDIRGGFYRPAYVHRAEVALDEQGAILGWKHAIAGPSIIAGTPFEPMMVKDGVDPTSVEGVSDSPYAIPNFAVTLHTVDAGVPVLWWRSVGHSHSAFVMETLIDEIAAGAKKDPVAFRRELLAGKPRVLNVLEVAAAKSGWGSPLPAGRARGIAVHESFGSVCAQVAEVSLESGAPRVHRVVAVFDCGLAVNPLGVAAQVQSAIAYGLGAALFSEITLADGKVEQSNFHDYRVLRMAEMPAIEVHLTGGGDRPTGVGEPATPPIAPAVANALFVLTGKRARRLPFSSQTWA